jgi:hypothetical protein
MTLSIQLPDDAERRLRAAADRLNVPVDVLAAAAVRDFVTQPAPEFDAAARPVLEKNSELYRRLAQVRYLTLGEVLDLHERLLQRWGGATGLRDLGALDPAVAQPRMTFGGVREWIDRNALPRSPRAS